MKKILTLIGCLTVAFVSSYILSIESPISMESYLLTYVLWALWGKDLDDIFPKKSRGK